MTDGDPSARPTHRDPRCWRPSRRRFLALAAAGIAAPLAFGCVPTRAGTPSDAAALPLAPELTLTLFQGGTFRLSEQRGKPVFVNFWASWCAPCKQEMPGFERVWQRHKNGDIMFVGADVNDLESDARHFLQDEVHVTYLVGRADDTEAARGYNVSGLPYSVFITADGRLAKTWLGGLTEDKLEAFLQQYL